MQIIRSFLSLTNRQMQRRRRRKRERTGRTEQSEHPIHAPIKGRVMVEAEVEEERKEQRTAARSDSIETVSENVTARQTIDHHHHHQHHDSDCDFDNTMRWKQSDTLVPPTADDGIRGSLAIWHSAFCGCRPIPTPATVCASPNSPTIRAQTTDIHRYTPIQSPHRGMARCVRRPPCRPPHM